MRDLSELRLRVEESQHGYGAVLMSDGDDPVGWEISTPWRLVAQRIAACVNYCVGLSTEEMERRVSERPALE